MAEDPYAVLGVARNASDEDIRRAFRRLAKECHPDLHPANATAADRFKRLTGANDVVGDPVKRRQYDRGEIDASGEPRRAYTHAYSGPRGGPRTARPGSPEDVDFGDIFSDFFSSQRAGRAGAFAARGQDVRYTLEVEFTEAVIGAKKRVTMPDGGTLDLTVPEGVIDGQVLRLKGKGALGLRGGEAGDALVEIKVRLHPQFKRVDNDIAIEVPITIDEAVLGGKIEVPTISGRVQLTLPKGTSSGKVFRLRGKGVRNVAAGTTGDQLVSVRISMPETIDDSLSYFFSEWRQKHRYDPGRGE